MNTYNNEWDWEIKNKASGWSLKPSEFWVYRHLLGSYIKRDFMVLYQQTILGPLWILVSPILTLLIYVLVFGKMIKIGTGNIPPVLFYFSGIVLWNCFSDIFSNTSSTIKDNYYLFSKVYFPRIIVPFSVTGTQLIRLLIQLVLLISMTAYYCIFYNFPFYFSIWSFAFLLSVVAVAMIALALGLLFSIITAKYRDIGNFIMIALRLLMYITPVVYPISAVSEKLRWVVWVNPLTPFFELFRLSLFGEGSFTLIQLFYSTLFLLALFLAAIWIFNKQCDKLIDIV
jgi:lipopolysaccharide transport system permease protein